MALGGGTFLTQNKILPGSYINFISATRASANLSDRGYVAIPLELNWGAENEVITVESANMQKDSFDIFGYAYTAPEMKPLREIFKGAKTAYVYRINSGGTKASKVAEPLTITAKYGGTRGNDIKVAVQINIDDETKFDIITYLEGKKVDEQTVATIEELQANNFVVFSGTGAPTVSAGISLTGGTNGAADGDSYSAFLDKIEAFSFNTLGYAGTDDLIKDLFIQFTKRMRDEHGVKFQTVVYRKNAADYEGIISVENKVLGEGAKEADLIYWVAGQAAGCPVNKSIANKSYDGEHIIDVNYKQSELETGLKTGKFMFHKVGDKVNVLDDINTFTSFTVDKSEDFNSNQVIRTIDQDAIDTALIFNTRYLGKVQNNDAGRIAFWNDIVELGKEMQKISAIEDFKADDITVEAGNDKKSVVVTKYIKPITAMTKLYVTTIVE
ncbi:phage tail sheath family protein [Alkaliphilus sp. B6464]|uniref:phage tail sheath family protein n=1 Tax=Alkaliphilus sp. B6464 TaxID=2731219 RepID=UPI001BAC2624|nr:phage tail sheath family protein [Alkaliphilus sp. B6464]QUH18937.1 phage tail sheath subtilisin-like domain-containing protein [Alkaliphilus sp. B6464]